MMWSSACLYGTDCVARGTVIRLEGEVVIKFIRPVY